MVAASLKYADAERTSRIRAWAGVWRHRRHRRAPAYSRALPWRSAARPGAPPTPAARPRRSHRSGAEPRETLKPEELAVEVALPEGPAGTAAAGYLYFATREKLSLIRSIDLLYDGAAPRSR